MTVGPGDKRITLPDSGLLAMRIGLEFGGAEAFVDSLVRAVIDGGSGGATVVALLDRGDLAIHIPRRDGPAWNVVPLLHLHPGEQPTDADWAVANATLERLERYR
ncbi:MAG TPA: hypothetical protein VFP83_07630 [Candidatus Limnocylindria bacterium]|nr:hypothetical protein [Candidatus Limnocylindria bacterium]